jgi:hypothetical protein
LSDREDLARQLFDLKVGSDEQEVRMASVVAGAILDDICARARVLDRKHGPGILVLIPGEIREEDQVIWAISADLENKIKEAERNQDTDFIVFFRALLRQLSLNDPTKKTLALIVDDRGQRLLTLDNDHPSMESARVIAASTKVGSPSSSSGANPPKNWMGPVS